MPIISSQMAEFFRNRFVRVIVLSSVLLQIGIWVRNFAILLFVMEKTGSDPYAISLISVAEFAPIFLFSFIGGTFADRWRPKRTMVICDLLSALSVFMVLLAIIFSTWEAVFFVTFISSVLSQFSQPSAMKLFKVHVPGGQLQMGMALFQTVMSIFMILGPIFGTVVYQNFGIYVAVGIMGIVFLLSAGVLTFLPPHEETAGEKPETHFWKEMTAGFHYVWRRKVLTVLGAVFVMAGFAVGIVQPLGIFIVTEQLGLPKESLQWLLAVNGAAMFIGGGLVLGITRKVSPQKLLAAGLFINAITVAGVGLSSSWAITLGLQFLSGLFMPCIQIGINTLILAMTEEAYIGRVNGVLNPLFMGAMVITMSCAGWLKVTLSLSMSYEVSAALFLVGMLLTVPLFGKTISFKTAKE